MIMDNLCLLIINILFEKGDLLWKLLKKVV